MREIHAVFDRSSSVWTANFIRREPGPRIPPFRTLFAACRGAVVKLFAATAGKDSRPSRRRPGRFTTANWNAVITPSTHATLTPCLFVPLSTTSHGQRPTSKRYCASFILLVERAYRRRVKTAGSTLSAACLHTQFDERLDRIFGGALIERDSRWGMDFPKPVL